MEADLELVEFDARGSDVTGVEKLRGGRGAGRRTAGDARAAKSTRRVLGRVAVAVAAAERTGLVLCCSR